MTVLWAAASTNIQLSAGNLVATQTDNDLTFSSVFSMAAGTVVKRYCEMQFLAATDITNNAVGIGDGNAALEDFMGDNLDSIGVYGDGTLWWGNSITGYPTFAAGDIVAIAVDDAAKFLWIKNVTAGSYWNNDPTSDPGAGTNGYDITGLVASNAGATLCQIGDSVLGNFAGPFAGIIPTGYRRWDGTTGVGGDGGTGNGNGGAGGGGTGSPTGPVVFSAKSKNIELSFDKLTAIQTSNDGVYSSVFSTLAGASAKRYCELQFTVGVDIGQDAVGIGNAIARLEDWMGSNADSIGVYSSGVLWWANTSIDGWPPFFVGDVVAIAVDDDKKFLWVKNLTTVTDWNNDPSADPGLGSGGYDITGLSATNIGATTLHVTDSVTANFDGPFIGIIPTNFRRWDGTLGVGSDGLTGDNPTADSEFNWHESSEGVGGGGLTIQTYITTLPRYVKTLEPPSLIMRGARTFVLDSTVTLSVGLGQQVVGGGKECVPVFCDGNFWLIG